ncbi:MAG: hypothetical protein RR348_04350, partial [Clostridia bacterium]
NECKRFIQYDDTKTMRFALSISIAMFIIPIIFATILWHRIFAIAIPPFILISILILIPQINSPMKIINLYIPKKLTIDANIISLESEKTTVVKSVLKIKKIIDVGEWYQILFYFPYKDPYFICQKDLITKGTIEDFEKLFEGKIVKGT